MQVEFPEKIHILISKINARIRCKIKNNIIMHCITLYLCFYLHFCVLLIFLYLLDKQFVTQFS